MKVYNLNVNVAQPVSQVVQMQQNQTGMLSVAVSNNGKYIRNLSCTMYDGDSEIQTAVSGDNSFGFKVDVGDEPKHVKVVAKSTPIESIKEEIASYTPGTRTFTQYLKRIVIPAGTYRQDEFESLKQFGDYSGMQIILSPEGSNTEKANFNRILITLYNPIQSLQFGKQSGGSVEWFAPDQLLVVNEEITFGYTTAVRTTNKNTIVLSSETYPAIGYWTDYQMDTTIRPFANAASDGQYVEPLTEVEVNGVKFVPTTLSVDGVEYKVLAEAQSTPETTEGE